MCIAIFSHLTLLHENTSFKTSAGRFISVFWRCAALSADQEKVLSFLPKLSCGFKVLKWCIYLSFIAGIVAELARLQLLSYTVCILMYKQNCICTCMACFRLQSCQGYRHIQKNVGKWPLNLDPTSAPVISKLGSKVLHYFGCGRFLKHTRARANKSDQTELLANCGLIYGLYVPPFFYTQITVKSCYCKFRSSIYQRHTCLYFHYNKHRFKIMTLIL